MHTTQVEVAPESFNQGIVIYGWARIINAACFFYPDVPYLAIYMQVIWKGAAKALAYGWYVSETWRNAKWIQ